LSRGVSDHRIEAWCAFKLVDYADRAEELQTIQNPFAAVVLAHLRTQETRTDPAGRRSLETAVDQNPVALGHSSQSSYRPGQA
jgi:hypothetical protein